MKINIKYHQTCALKHYSITYRPEVVGVIFSPQKRLQVFDVSQSGAHSNNLSLFWRRTEKDHPFKRF